MWHTRNKTCAFASTIGVEFGIQRELLRTCAHRTVRTECHGSGDHRAVTQAPGRRGTCKRYRYAVVLLSASFDSDRGRRQAVKVTGAWDGSMLW